MTLLYRRPTLVQQKMCIAYLKQSPPSLHNSSDSYYIQILNADLRQLISHRFIKFSIYLISSCYLPLIISIHLKKSLHIYLLSILIFRSRNFPIYLLPIFLLFTVIDTKFKLCNILLIKSFLEEPSFLYPFYFNLYLVT